jgi:acyl-CoA thioesterase
MFSSRFSGLALRSRSFVATLRHTIWFVRGVPVFYAITVKDLKIVRWEA